MNKISLIHLMHKALHKMQSDRKRTEKGNPVAWRLRHFSWQSRVTSAAVIISVFYIHWKEKNQLSGETDAETQLRLTDLLLKHRVLLHIPAPQSDRRRIWTYIPDIQVSILITELSDFFSFFLFREADYVPVFWCIGKQPVGIWTKQTSFPSFFPDRKGVSMSPSSNKLGTWDIWQRLFLWSQY